MARAPASWQNGEVAAQQGGGRAGGQRDPDRRSRSCRRCPERPRLREDRHRRRGNGRQVGVTDRVGVAEAEHLARRRPMPTTSRASAGPVSSVAAVQDGGHVGEPGRRRPAARRPASRRAPGRRVTAPATSDARQPGIDVVGGVGDHDDLDVGPRQQGRDRTGEVGPAEDDHPLRPARPAHRPAAADRWPARSVRGGRCWTARRSAAVRQPRRSRDRRPDRCRRVASPQTTIVRRRAVQRDRLGGAGAAGAHGRRRPTGGARSGRRRAPAARTSSTFSWAGPGVPGQRTLRLQRTARAACAGQDAAGRERAHPGEVPEEAGQHNGLVGGLVRADADQGGRTIGARPPAAALRSGGPPSRPAAGCRPPCPTWSPPGRSALTPSPVRGRGSRRRARPPGRAAATGPRVQRHRRRGRGGRCGSRGRARGRSRPGPAAGRAPPARRQGIRSPLLLSRADGGQSCLPGCGRSGVGPPVAILVHDDGAHADLAVDGHQRVGGDVAR